MEGAGVGGVRESEGCAWGWRELEFGLEVEGGFREDMRFGAGENRGGISAE